MTGEQSCTTSQRLVFVVVGAKTRLGAMIIARLRLTNASIVLTARHAADLQWASQHHGDLPCVLAAMPLPQAVSTADRVALIVCALGPSHPARPNLEADVDTLSQDVALVRSLAESVRGTLHIVHVSTVLALTPPRDRCHYGGFKNLAESQLAQIASCRPQAGLTVVYPGRLAEGKSLLGTSYSKLAGLLCAIATRAPGGNRIVGLDARLWLMKRSAMNLLSALSGLQPAPRPELRDGEPRS